MTDERTVVYFGTRGDKKQRKPTKPTRALVERWAESYVNRYYSPEASLRATLERRIRRGCEAHHTDQAEAHGWAEIVITRLRQAGVIDDARWARDKARALAERGVPARGIRQRLRVKRLDATYIDAAIAALGVDRAGEPVDAAWEAAIAYARRRRLGPFRRDSTTRAAFAQKDLAALARAGHSYGVARQILDAESAEELGYDSGNSW